MSLAYRLAPAFPEIWLALAACAILTAWIVEVTGRTVYPFGEMFVGDLMAHVLKLVIYVGLLTFMGNLARRGLLPRTRPIVPGELAVSD